jgi:hypothetical protein
LSKRERERGERGSEEVKKREGVRKGVREGVREGEKKEIIDGGRGKVGKESWRVIQRERDRETESGI